MHHDSCSFPKNWNNYNADVNNCQDTDYRLSFVSVRHAMPNQRLPGVNESLFFRERDQVNVQFFQVGNAELIDLSWKRSWK